MALRPLSLRLPGARRELLGARDRRVGCANRGLAPSRERARAMVLAAHVRVDGSTVTKAGAQVDAEAEVTLIAPDHPPLPMAWNFPGLCRKSLISWSSSIASSAPATSAKVVLGVSLVISLARDLPKFITREPPPCIWFMKTRNSRKIAISGR